MLVWRFYKSVEVPRYIDCLITLDRQEGRNLRVVEFTFNLALALLATTARENSCLTPGSLRWGLQCSSRYEFTKSDYMCSITPPRFWN